MTGPFSVVVAGPLMVMAVTSDERFLNPTQARIWVAAEFTATNPKPIPSVVTGGTSFAPFTRAANRRGGSGVPDGVGNGVCVAVGDGVGKGVCVAVGVG